jgi:hypothetical protein
MSPSAPETHKIRSFVIVGRGDDDVIETKVRGPGCPAYLHIIVDTLGGMVLMETCQIQGIKFPVTVGIRPGIGEF